MFKETANDSLSLAHRMGEGGRQQLRIHCDTIVDYATMPKSLRFGRTEVFKVHWDEDKKFAFYRENGIHEDILEAVKHLM